MRETDDLGEWLAANWDPDLSLLDWRTRLVAAGWRWDDEAVGDALRAVGAPGFPDGVGMTLVVPTVLEHGSADVQDRFVRATVAGKSTWCQLFSDPGAGSDLAGLATRADRDGDVWRVNGQKVWNTSAHHADYGLLLARTDWDAPKHRGITCFALPMHQPGVEVRPLRQMNGHASFNEVFFADAEIPDDHVIGAVDGGWAVALTTLAHERRLAQHRPTGARREPAGRAVREALAETERNSQPYSWYPSAVVGLTCWSSTPAPRAGATTRSYVRKSPVPCRWHAPRSGPRRVLWRRDRAGNRRAPKARSASWRRAASPVSRRARIL